MYLDILSVVYIYCITEPELRNTDQYYYADKESDRIDEKKNKNSIINSKLKNAYQYYAQ